MEFERGINNRGIVLLAGGVVYFLNAYINCRMLLEMGCKMPIEWFYMGEEMKPRWIKKIQSTLPNVTLIDMGSTGNKKNTKHKGGWQNKVNAILKSSFNEVLFLDADCFPLKDPEYLFDHDFFTETGCVLFPDPFQWTEAEAEKLSTKFKTTIPRQQVESGQMMFTKDKCMAGLLRVKELNDNHEDTYKFIYGDKDTFLIGMLQADAPMRVGQFQCTEAKPQGMVHKDFEGNDIFVHLAPAKWQVFGIPQIRVVSYPLRPKAMKVLWELRGEKLL